MKDQEFYHIIEKQLIGDITSEERSRLEAWLLHSTENRELFGDFATGRPAQKENTAGLEPTREGVPLFQRTGN